MPARLRKSSFSETTETHRQAQAARSRRPLGESDARDAVSQENERSTLIALLLVALLRGAPADTSAPELRTAADTTAMIAAAWAKFERGSILSVGRVLVPAVTRIRDYDDTSILMMVADMAHLRLDTVTQVSQLPDCPTAPGRRQPRGYRVNFVSLERRSVPFKVARWEQFYYWVMVDRSCRYDDGVVYASSLVQLNPLPDTTLSFRWSVVKADHYPDEPALRPPHFSGRLTRLSGNAFNVLVWCPLLFPLLGLLFGGVSGRRGLMILLGIWSLAGLPFAALLGTTGFAAWLLPFLAPAGAYVLRAQPTVANAAAPLELGRATIVFVVAYVTCFIVFYLAMMGVFAA